MYQIRKRFEFSASHRLDGLPDGHPCGRLHGHNYAVEVVCEAGVLDARGFVFDYGDLAPFKAWLDRTVDHRHLNDVMAAAEHSGSFQPTAELLAAWFYRVAHSLGIPAAEVRVSETPKTWATYRPA